jgi:hypothetical protein
VAGVGVGPDGASRGPGPCFTVSFPKGAGASSTRLNERRLGAVEAPDEAAAIEKGAAEFKAPANRLMAVRR